MAEPKLLLDGQVFLEGPRWHDGKLWFSDMHMHQVKTVDLNGHDEVIAEVAAWPSGLGWLPDGRLLIVSMTDRKLLRRDPDGLKVHADLEQARLVSLQRHGRRYQGPGLRWQLRLQPVG